MTEKANNQRVTQAYRDLATETTPPGLDDEVLRIATREARSRYGIARAWVRPVAWAATIGLSLAIMLEVLQVIPPAADPESAPMREEQAERGDAAESPGAARVMMDPAPVNPGGGAAEELGARRTAPQDRPRQKEVRPVSLDDADSFAARDMRILEEAEAQARQHAGEPAVAAAAAVAADAHCDETARATAESWYACIEELRDAGQVEFAGSELDALLLAFPDFEVPGPDK